MSTSLQIAVNISSNNTPYTASGAAWIDIDTAADYFIFSAGSDTISDGQTLPTQSQLNQAGVVLNGSQQVVSKYFLADASENRLWDIDLMGNTTSRYVLAFIFSGATATEPVLELWDDSDLNTVNNESLGSGTPSNSWWKGIVTTTSTPSSNWTGVSLAGSSNSHYLSLNDGNGALAGADELYCNIKIVIPASASTGLNELPVFAVKYASN